MSACVCCRGSKTCKRVRKGNCWPPKGEKMAETTDSLSEFFGTHAFRLSEAQQTSLQERLRGQGYPTVAAKFTSEGDSLTKELDKLLKISFGDIFAAAWNKSQELRQYTHQTRYPPDKVNFVSLLKHT